MTKKSFPHWLKSLLIAIPLGVVFGGAIPFLYFQSESRDWGKVYSTYNDFVKGYALWGLEYIAIATAVFWLLGIAIMAMIKHRSKATVPPASVESVRE